MSLLAARTLQSSGILYTHVKAKKPARRSYGTLLLFTAIIAFFIFSVLAFILSLPSKTTAKGPQTAALAAAPIIEAASGGTPSLEVHISNDGLVLLRAAQVTAVNGNTITLGMSWGTTSFNWIVHTNASSSGTHNYGTRFIDRNGNTIAFDTIQKGTFVTVTGMLESNANVPTVDADSVRSLQ